jgi:hypothetical protein
MAKSGRLAENASILALAGLCRTEVGLESARAQFPQRHLLFDQYEHGSGGRTPASDLGPHLGPGRNTGISVTGISTKCSRRAAIAASCLAGARFADTVGREPLIPTHRCPVLH